MMFRRAFKQGEPVKMTAPDGCAVLILGYVSFPNCVGFVDDGYLDIYGSHPPLHFIDGNMKIVGETEVVAGHVFAPVEQGDPAAGIWYKMLAKRDPMTFHEDTEYLIRTAYLDKLVSEAAAKS
jgi:hypothetical protein